MIEVRFHGRGGQGAVVASSLLAEAAYLNGFDVQSFPYFGVERRGAPVTAFTKLDKQKIRVKSQIYTPDVVIVLDPSLLDSVNVLEGLKDDGCVIVNGKKEYTEKLMTYLVAQQKLVMIDATDVAVRHGLGSRAAPIVNTAILGAFAAATGHVTMENVNAAILNAVPRSKEKNAAAAKDAFDIVTRTKECDC